MIEGSESMIYTLTINPAVDVYMDFDAVYLGKLNRCSNQTIKIGGKGINVSLALKSLGVESVPIAVIGGFTGEFIKKELEKEFHPYLLYSKHPTRINVKVKSKEETELNGTNHIEEELIDVIHSYLKKLTKTDYLVVSGTASLSTYKKLLTELNCRIILDVDGQLLKELLYIKPWLVKPNDIELKEISKNVEEAYSILLQDVEYVLHTKGNEGVCFISLKEKHEIQGLKTSIVSTIGCGDAALAGFLAQYILGKDMKFCVEFCNQCGYYRAKTGQFLIQN